MNLRLPVDSFSVFKTTTRERWDPWTPIAMAGLGAFGIAFIYSAQLPVQGRGWIVQLLWLLIGAAVYVTVSLIDYQFADLRPSDDAGHPQARFDVCHQEG